MSIMDPVKQRTEEVFRSEEGLAFIEFAFCVGLLVAMFIGAVEVSRYILIIQKMEKTVDTLTDVLTQLPSGPVDNAALTQYLSASQNMMQPYAFGVNGIVILTDIFSGTTPTAPVIQWQACTSPALPGAVSKIGTSSGNPATPNPANLSSFGSYTMNANEEIVVGEIYYKFTPILTQSILGPTTIYRHALFKPRFGGLISTSTCP